MDLTESILTTIRENTPSVSYDNVDYYWSRFKGTVLANYYYYFPPRPQETVFLMLDAPELTEVTFVTDDLGNSVFKD